MTAQRFGDLDPRSPRKSLLAIVLVLLVLGFVAWILLAWPESVLFGSP